MSEPDHDLVAPAIPAANTDFYLYDPDAVAFIPKGVSWQGLVGNLKFDQAVSIFVEEPSTDGTYRVMNGSAGAGETVLANEPYQVRINFLGKKTRVRLRTGATPPTSATSVIAARLTHERPVQG